ncbi:MAG: secondary thiamine-phosphate synthase enzyme YjbQ [Spirochaetaceae bacterium]|nr:secondary thiamine-phosphate synthase enzyme YjbQ [Spirochaetaceae bacterium]MDT8298049.1 secondary thiamine-phosphate synthase enzyme YjbQ [Spirochaetaceae bacterium]
MTKEFPVETGAGDTITDITDAVQKVVSSGRIEEGICVVSSPHTTVGVTVNENYDPDVKKDMLMKLVDLIPREDGYRHMEGNSAAHLKATITGISVTLPIIDGRLALGRWQGIYFCDYDGPRRRRVRVSIVGS